jgi:regulator of protease activity HflC (stomatin/prohibitin superfamily)
MTGVYIAIGVVVVFLLVVIPASIKIVREYQRIVLFRLGRSVGTRGPGLIFIIPIIDRVTWVDLRERFLEIPHQTAITQDNAPISIDFIIFHKVIDAVMSVLQVQNFAGAAQNIAATTLRSVVGDMSLDDVLSKREEMNRVLQVKLDEVTERWGVKVTNVEVREIIPPPAVQEAMTRQMSAERTRRAVVTEAEGQKTASVTVAEGQKQAAILQAEGDRQAAILRAEGFSLALEKIFQVARTLDSNTMSLQYLDALKQIGSSPSTKFVVPMELANMLSSVTGLTARSFGNGQNGSPGPAVGTAAELQTPKEPAPVASAPERPEAPPDSAVRAEGPAEPPSPPPEA